MQLLLLKILNVYNLIKIWSLDYLVKKCKLLLLLLKYIGTNNIRIYNGACTSINISIKDIEHVEQVVFNDEKIKL